LTFFASFAAFLRVLRGKVFWFPHRTRAFEREVRQAKAAKDAKQMERLASVHLQLDNQKKKPTEMHDEARRAGMHTTVYDPSTDGERPRAALLPSSPSASAMPNCW
jgi:hypothetical protein